MPRRYYVLWLVAMALAETGSTFDVSYHFGHLFDYFSIPHMTVGVGVSLMVALLVWALVIERKRVVGLERTALRVGAAALAVGLADEPFDLLWHVTFGVDISLWSPTHLMLNYPTDVLNVCLVAALLASPAARQWGAWAIALGFGLRNVMTTHFALYQQEYGSVALAGLSRTGQAPWNVDPELLRLAGPRAAQLVTGGAPDWLYLVYFPLALCYALTFGAAVLSARPRRGKRRTYDAWPWPFGAATALALCYVFWRLAFRTWFIAIHAAYPVIPWYIVPMGLVIDVGLVFGPRAVHFLVVRRAPQLGPHVRLLAAGASGVLAGLALFGGMQLMRALHLVVPVAPALALPFAGVTGAAGAVLGTWVAARVRQSVSRRHVPRETRPSPALLSVLTRGRRASQPVPVRTR